MAKIRYKKIPKKLIASAALIALLGGGAAYQALDTVADFEGYVPEGYRDPVGIPTKCFGDTRDVTVGKEYTFEECQASLNEHLYEIARPVTRCVKGFQDLHDKTKIALVSMAYNIGSGAMCKSSIVKFFNAGNHERGCRRMAEVYKYATDRRTGEKKELPGLAKRRNFESNLCLQGVRAKAGGD